MPCHFDQPLPGLMRVRCRNTEEAWFEHVGHQQQLEWEQREHDEDVALRLAGPCERCHEDDGHGLTISGGEALCDGCVEAELLDDAEGSTP